jgi:hypothetical protein
MKMNLLWWFRYATNVFYVGCLGLYRYLCFTTMEGLIYFVLCVYSLYYCTRHIIIYHPLKFSEVVVVVVTTNLHQFITPYNAKCILGRVKMIEKGCSYVVVKRKLFLFLDYNILLESWDVEYNKFSISVVCLVIRRLIWYVIFKICKA